MFTVNPETSYTIFLIFLKPHYQLPPPPPPKKVEPTTIFFKFSRFNDCKLFFIFSSCSPHAQQLRERIDFWILHKLAKQCVDDHRADDADDLPLGQGQVWNIHIEGAVLFIGELEPLDM